MCFSLGESSTKPAPGIPGGSGPDQKTTSTVSLKVEAALSEVDLLVRGFHKSLAEVKVRGT